MAKLQREVAIDPAKPDRRKRQEPPHADPIARASKKAFIGLQDSAVGLEFGVSVVIALAFGVWLDGKAGTNPLFMFLCLAIGLTAGFRGIYRAVRRADKAAKAEGHG